MMGAKRVITYRLQRFGKECIDPVHSIFLNILCSVVQYSVLSKISKSPVHAENKVKHFLVTLKNEDEWPIE